MRATRKCTRNVRFLTSLLFVILAFQGLQKFGNPSHSDYTSLGIVLFDVNYPERVYESLDSIGAAPSKTFVLLVETPERAANSLDSDWITTARLKYPHIDIQTLPASELHRSTLIKNPRVPWICIAPSGARLDSQVQTQFQEEPLAYQGRDAFIYNGGAIVYGEGALMDGNDAVTHPEKTILDLSLELATTFWGSLFVQGKTAIVSSAHFERLIRSTTADLFETIHHASMEYLPAIEFDNRIQRQIEAAPQDINLKVAWKKPILSVIVSLHQAEQPLLTGMLDSLCRQSFHDFEVVFVTEESTLPMYVALQKLHCFRYRVFQLDALADVAAQVNNVGGLIAHGKYLAFLDAKDALMETCLEKLVWTLEMDSSVDFAYPGMVSFGPDMKNITTRIKFDSKLLQEQNFIPSLFVIRKRIYEQYGGMGISFANGLEEYDLWLRLTGEERRGRLVPEELYLRRQHPSRPSRLDNIQANISKSMLEELQKRNPKAFGMNSSRPFLPLHADPNYQKIRVHPRSFQLDSIIAAEHLDAFAGSQESLTISPIVAKHHTHSSTSKHVIHVLYFVPLMVVGGSEKVDLDILSSLGLDGDSFQSHDDASFHVTLIVDQDTVAPAWEDRFLELSNEVFVPRRYCDSDDCARQLVDYLVLSRNPSILFIRNSLLGYEAAKKCKQLALSIQSVDLLHLYIPGGAWEVISIPYHSYLDRRLVISNDMRRHMNDSLHLPLEAFDVIYNGVDFGEAAAAEEESPRTIFTLEPRLKQFSKIVGYTGRIAPEKDPLFWMNVALELFATDPTIGFVVIGDGGLKETMQDVAMKSKAKDHIFFLGYQDNPRQLFPDMDVLVTTSLFEGLPLVVVDAVYQGVPVVARNVGAMHEVIQHDYNGYLMGYDEPAYKYVPFITKAFDLFQGPRAENRKRSIERVQQDFSLSKMKESYRRILVEMSTKKFEH